MISTPDDDEEEPIDEDFDYTDADNEIDNEWYGGAVENLLHKIEKELPQSFTYVNNDAEVISDNEIKLSLTMAENKYLEDQWKREARQKCDGWGQLYLILKSI
jgi:hypothetical protein